MKHTGTSCHGSYDGLYDANSGDGGLLLDRMPSSPQQRGKLAGPIHGVTGFHHDLIITETINRVLVPDLGQDVPACRNIQISCDPNDRLTNGFTVLMFKFVLDRLDSFLASLSIHRINPKHVDVVVGWIEGQGTGKSKAATKEIVLNAPH